MESGRRDLKADLRCRPSRPTARRSRGAAAPVGPGASDVFADRGGVGSRVAEQRALLGWPAASTFHKYKSGDYGPLSFDTLTRISLVLGIYKALQVLYPDPAWPTGGYASQRAPVFGGRPALALMIGGGIDGLLQTRRLLDARRADGVRLRRCPRQLARHLAPDSQPVSVRRPVRSRRLSRTIWKPSSSSRTGPTIASTPKSDSLHAVPPDEWVTGRPMASVVMAAYCHPNPAGTRFAGPQRGAWYAGRKLETALAESVFHRARELRDVGITDARLQMRLYRADFRTTFHDLRGNRSRVRGGPRSRLVPRVAGAGRAATRGRIQRSRLSERSARRRRVRRLLPSAAVTNVRAAAHYVFIWEGAPEPRSAAPRHNRT